MINANPQRIIEKSLDSSDILNTFMYKQIEERRKNFEEIKQFYSKFLKSQNIVELE